MNPVPRCVRCGLLRAGFVLVSFVQCAPLLDAQTTPTMVQAFTYYCQAEDFVGVAPAPAAGQWGRVSGTYFGGTAIQDDTASESQAVTYTFHVPTDGTYYLWIAHLTDTNQFTTFDLVIEHGGSPVTNVTYATAKATAARNDTNYVYRPGSWEAWSKRAVRLPKGAITLKLAHNAAATQAAVVDAIQIVGTAQFTPDWTDTVTKPFSYWVEAETFDGGTNTPIVGGAYQWVGNWWNIYAGYAASGGLEALAYFSVSDDHPLTHTFSVPKAGTYYLWMAHNTNPSYLIPEVVEVIQNGVTVTNVVFGWHTPQNDQSDPDYHFQVGTWRCWSMHPATLQPGPVTLKVYYNHPGRQSYGMWDMMQIVDDPTFTPQFGMRYTEVPDMRFRVRLDAIQSTTMPAPTDWYAISYYYSMWAPLPVGGWSDWIDVSGAMKDAFYNMYYNLYSGHRWPFVSPFVVYPYSVSNMTMSVEWECGPLTGAYSATYDGGGFSVLLWRDSQAPLPHQVGPSWMFNKRYVDTINSLTISTNDLPRQFVFVDRYIGVDFDRTACEEGLAMLRKIGMTVIDAGGYPRGKQVLTQLGIGKTAGAVYIPPEIFDRDLSLTTDAVMDNWAQSQANSFVSRGWNPQDVAWFGMSDEPGWYYPYMFTAGPDLPGVFRSYLQNKGFVPADFGKNDWSEVNFLGRSAAVDLPSRRLFYWSMRFFPDNSADVFARWTRAMERAFYPGMIMPVNWNNFEGRYYTWGGIANNPNPTHPDAAFGSHDWIDFGRRRGVTTLWTEDWFGDSSAHIWSAYVSKLRSATYRYNDARTNGGPVAINFGGYVIGATAGGQPGGTLQKVLSILGHGGKAIYFYIFGPEYSFPGNCYSENFAYYPELADALQTAGKAEDLLYPGQPVRAEVAILQPQSPQCWDTSYNGSDYLGEASNLYNALQDSHIPSDWVDEQDLEEGNLSQFKVLYITGPNLPAQAVTELQQWIQAGGVAVFTAGAAQFDRYNEPSTAINATLGIAASPRSRLYWPAYTNGMGVINSSVPGLSSFDASGFAQALTPTTASIKATFASSGQPAVTLNAVGSGQVVVFGTFVGTAYTRGGQTAARDWVAWPVQLAGVTLPVDFNAPKVEAATLQSSNGLAVTLLNWTGSTVSNLALTVRSSAPISRVDSVRLGTSLPFTQNGDAVGLTLPSLGAADVLKLYALIVPPTTVTIAASDASASEPGSNTGEFTVTRTGATNLPLTVNYTVGGTATAGSDYTALTGSVTIPAGSTSATITVSPLADSLVEGTETVVITLAANPAYLIGSPNTATVDIADGTPGANFSANFTNGVAPLTVEFTDTSTGAITNLFWDFGDGVITNTTAATLTHTYRWQPPGDVNKDHRVSGADSLLVNQVLVGLRTTNDPVFRTNLTVRLVAQGPTGASTNNAPNYIGLGIFPNGDINASDTVTGADSLLINQVLVRLRSYVVSKILPGSHSSSQSTAVTIYGIGFLTNGTVTAVNIGPPVNLALTNVVVINREQITALVPAGGGIGTGTVHVVATPTNGVTSFGRFVNQ